MLLGKRLLAVASFVKEGDRVMDVGTDHAKVPIYLFEKNKIPYAIASDKNKGPLEFAKKNITAAGFEKNIEVRLSDGLKGLKTGEVDTVIIAGMGGALITKILSNSPEILSEISRIILQPMNEGQVLRKWLRENNFKTEDEILVKEDDKIYEIISVCRGKTGELSMMELLLGPLILKNKNEILRERINNIIIKTKQKISGMEKSKNAVKSEEYIIEKNKLKSLEELLW